MQSKIDAEITATEESLMQIFCRDFKEIEETDATGRDRDHSVSS